MASLRWPVCVVLVCSLVSVSCKKHHLELKGDSRQYFPISTFGFYRNGHLTVDVSKFRVTPKLQPDELFGFSLEKMANPYTDHRPETCELSHLEMHDALVQKVLFTFNITAMKVTVRCSEDMRDLHIYEDMREVAKYTQESQPLHRLADTALFHKQNSFHDQNSVVREAEDSSSPAQSTSLLRRRRRAAVSIPPPASPASAPAASNNATSGSPREPKPATTAALTAEPSDSHHINIRERKCNDVTLPITLKDDFYNFVFVVFVANEKEEGLYNLDFHNCHNYDPSKHRASIDMTLMVVELNPDDNYLSAGEMPLPALYLMMALLFLLSAAFWFFLLRKSKEPVFKIHYLMGVLVVIKSLSLLFHAINYHFIQIQGTHMEAWAVMYYIMHLLKGALLFTVLALIGSGWAFIKHILSSKEKKIFMIVIPLQIIANVASIIIEETDEWDPEKAVWARLLFLVDFLCCAAILLPVVWSIRHLQEASHTDGKAAVNLSKLKLFRHFYIMVVCYIYFTRIIVYLLRITVPFQYEWLDDMFREMATYVFFVLTGYKFRPANSNPYFLLTDGLDDDEDEDDVVLTTTGLTENVSRINKKETSKFPSTDGSSVTRKKKFESSSDMLSEVVHQDDHELNLLLASKEDSHDLD
ncbi:Lung seven transmembrane receptor-like [Trinorchestia longiramus]|nr:Lung seven transmembrane receptor-like [Trinorchestia longiramus]